jgi:hypothetical protein
MKRKILTYVWLLPLMYLAINNQVMAQDMSRADRVENERADSLKTQQRKDSDNLSELKADRAETRKKLKEAQRVERDANGAARESKLAYKAERNAQKARIKANKQAKKAAKARSVSDDN